MRRDKEVESAVQVFQKAVSASDLPKLPKSPLPPVMPTDPNPNSARTAEPSHRSPVNAPIPVRAAITEYTSVELQALLRWVKSDGKLRTNDELADEMFGALPFS